MTRLPHTQTPFPSIPASPPPVRGQAKTSSPVRVDWRARVTPREREILDHLARGLLYTEIARALGLRTPTVKNHLHRIYAKIEVRSRTEAVIKWLAAGPA